MKKVMLLLKGILLSILLVFSIQLKSQQVYKITKTIVSTSLGSSRGYIAYLPKGYDSLESTRYPLIIYMHGQGEVGNGQDTSLEKIFRNQFMKSIKDSTFVDSASVNGITKKFLVMAPQSEKGYSQIIGGALSYFISKYKVDTTRIYLTGISMGGWPNLELSYRFYNQ